MSDEPGLGGRDEPARGTDDYAEPLSELGSHDPAMWVSETAAADAVGRHPPDAGRPDRFDPGASPGGQVTTADEFADTAFESSRRATALASVRDGRHHVAQRRRGALSHPRLAWSAHGAAADETRHRDGPPHRVLRQPQLGPPRSRSPVRTAPTSATASTRRRAPPTRTAPWSRRTAFPTAW